MTNIHSPIFDHWPLQGRLLNLADEGDVERVRAAMQTMYPDAISVFVFGSALTGANDRLSDTDAMVLLPSPKSKARHRVRCAGSIFDLHVGDMAYYMGMLRCHAKSRHGFYIQKSIEIDSFFYLRGTSSDWAAFVKEANDVLAHLPEMTKWDALSTSLAKAIRSIARSGTASPDHVAVADAYVKILTVLSLQRRKYLDGVRYMAEWLSGSDPSRYRFLHSAMVRAMKGDVDDICELANDTLQSIGGAIRPDEGRWIA